MPQCEDAEEDDLKNFLAWVPTVLHLVKDRTP